MSAGNASPAELTKTYRDNIVGIFALRIREHLRNLDMIDAAHQEMAAEGEISPGADFAFSSRRSRERHRIDRLLHEAATRASCEVRDDGFWHQLPMTGAFYRSIEKKVFDAARLSRPMGDSANNEQE